MWYLGSLGDGGGQEIHPGCNLMLHSVCAQSHGGDLSQGVSPFDLQIKRTSQTPWVVFEVLRSSFFLSYLNSTLDQPG